MRLLIIITIVVYNVAGTDALTCSEVLEFPSDKNWTVMELQTIQPKEMVECLAQLGKEQLPPEGADFIWKSIISFYGGIENIPESVLMILHWVTTAVKPEDYANLTLDSIDVIENFGLNYNLNREQLAAIANRVRDGFAGKEPEDYTYFDLMALKQILCQFNRSEIEKIHPSAYKEAAVMIGKLKNCDDEPLMGFAALAMSAFGAPDGWTEATVKTMGIVARYLPQERIKVDGSDKLNNFNRPDA